MFTKQTITRKSIDELSKVCPGVTLPSVAQSTIYGQGNGTEGDPFTWDEFLDFMDSDYSSRFPSGSGAIYYINRSGNLEGAIMIGTVDIIEPRPNPGGGTGNLTDPEEEDDDVSGNKPTPPTGGSGSIGGGGGGSMGGGATGGSSIQPPLLKKTVMTTPNFVGYDKNDNQGCLSRCVNMLEKVGVTSKGSSPRINVTQMGVNGRAGAVIPEGLKEGISYINQSLKDGKPVIAGVDYKAANYNDDKTTDHFVVIMGVSESIGANGQVITQYRYFDPATSYPGRGTSADNLFTVTDNGITGSFFKGNDSQQRPQYNDYTVTQIRFNH